MARLTKEELWEFFRDGDRPDENAFKDLLDSCYNSDYQSVLLVRSYGTAPVNPLLYDYYINASQNQLYQWNASEWVAKAGDKSVLYKDNNTALVYVFDGSIYTKLGGSDLVAGDRITITGNVISADDMYYNDSNVRLLISGNTNAITSEISARTSGDSALQTAINNEASARSQSDSALTIQISNKQDILNSGVNIKTVENQSLLVTDSADTNITIATFKEMPSFEDLEKALKEAREDSGATINSMASFGEAIVAYGIEPGDSWLGEVYSSEVGGEFPTGVGNSEVRVYCNIPGLLVFELTSIDTPPYHWICQYYDGTFEYNDGVWLGTACIFDSGETSFVTTWSSEKINSELSNKQNTLVSGTNIKTINGVSILGSGDTVIECENNLYIGTKAEREAFSGMTTGTQWNETGGTEIKRYIYTGTAWEEIKGGNLLIGTEAERLALVNPAEGIEFNQVTYDSGTSRYSVMRYLRENNDWRTLETPQTETEETVYLHISTWDGLGEVSGIAVGVTDNTSHETLSRNLDGNGNCTFKIVKGHLYTITVADLAGYHSLPDETFRASMDERSINMIYQALATNYETVIAHVTVYNKNLVDITATDTDFIGMNVELVVSGESSARAGVIGSDHSCTFTVEYGKTYSLTAPIKEGYRIRFEQSKVFTHTAGVPQRTLPMHYMEWEDAGIYGLDSGNTYYSFEAIEAMSQAERSSIIAVAVNTSRLATAGAGFCYKVGLEKVNGLKWSNPATEFDKTKLPFRGSHPQAVLDLDGFTNTQNIIDIGDSIGADTPAADYCQSKTLTIGGVTKTGFLGAYGQMYALAENIAVLNALHALLGVSNPPGFTSGYWWSSCQYNGTNAVFLANGGFYGLSKDSTNHTTLPLFAL